MNYSILIPPIQKPFDKFTFGETKEYFEWYISKINERVAYLAEVSNVKLNYTIDSFVDVWSWFIKIAKTENTPKEKLENIRKQLKGKPRDFVETILREQSVQFTVETEYIIRDIAMYFGETIVRNNNSVYWGYHTDIKKDSFANSPILMGFEDRKFNPPFQAAFDPNFIVRGLAYNVFDGSYSETDLLNMYHKWQRIIFN